jgi:thiol:disulfide interchange protein
LLRRSGGNPVLSVFALSMEGLFRISILCDLAGTGRNQACKWLK